MNEIDFDIAFEALTDNKPFPWQQALYKRFVEDRPDSIPKSCNLPTGLGKTSVIAIWLIALANHPAKMPRRLVYVVNRRTVVDQTTDEVSKYRQPLADNGPPWNPILLDLSERLRTFSSNPKECPLALSTLRGQFADNREWSADPSRPAVICGTVDMIGSRLLFSGYGIGFKSRPLHAGFLGQDVLLVHDEAHLEPAFQELIVSVQKEQDRCEEFGNFRVMELTATSRGTGDVFKLSEKDFAEGEVMKRIGAKKAIQLHENKDEKKLADEIAEIALLHKDSGKAVLVFVRKVDDVEKVIKKLPKDSFEQLTGTLRGLERDALVKKPIFQRFLPKAAPEDKTVFLVCTSAGEVGVNISADHLVCDLSTFDSMAQRFGRVNRFGNCTDTRIDIVHPKEFEDDDLDSRRKKTLDLLVQLNGVGSPAALGNLDPDARVAAFAPPPIILPVTDILFDAWALTTIKGQLPGRPMVEPYLHGVEDEKSFDTEFAWREEVALLTGKVGEDELADWLDEFPLRPHETLRIPTFGKRRAYEQLELIAARTKNLPVWVIEPDGELKTFASLSELVAKRGKDYAVPLAARTVVLPPKAGGLTKIGTLDGDSAHSDTISYDVAGTPPEKVPSLLRLKVIRGEEGSKFKLVAPTSGWPAEFSLEFDENRWNELNGYLKSLNLSPVKVVYRIDLTTDSEDDTPVRTPSEYLIFRPIPAKKAETVAAEWPVLDRHLSGVQSFADQICTGLKLDAKLAKAVSLAAAWHDLGKGRAVWQRGAGNKPTNAPVAKTLHGRPPENLNHFRHELGSLVDVVAVPEFAEQFRALETDQCELVLHLIATHHGRGRPHFPTTEAFDQDRSNSLVEGVVGEVPGRFARLQRKYGRWRLAYLESLLRAADALESRRIEAAPIPKDVAGSWADRAPTLLPHEIPTPPTPSITVAVDPTNPGQFFACCGLLELADRLWPGAEGWFGDGRFQVSCGGTIGSLFAKLTEIGLSSALTPELQVEREELESRKRALKRERKSLPKGEELRRKELGTLFREGSIRIGEPFNLLLDWWQSDDDSNPKTWAGSQAVIRIASAALESSLAAMNSASPFDYASVMYSAQEDEEGDEEGGKVEPFYFDARRAPNAHSRDVGFAPNDLGMTTLASPAVEFLCLVGLQRALPAQTDEPRIYDYFAWPRPMPPELLPALVTGEIQMSGSHGYRFENWFRTGQRKHKAFRSAIPLSQGD